MTSSSSSTLSVFQPPPNPPMLLFTKTSNSPMEESLCHYRLLLLLLFLSVPCATQLPLSESRAFLQIQQLLSYPPFLPTINATADFCNLEPTQSLTLICYQDSITQLHINGENGFPPHHQNVTVSSFFSALSSLTSLKVVSLVSLGLLGPLPSSINQLHSLEILNVSSNYLNGSIPVELSFLTNLQSLILDNNQFTGRVPGWLSSLSDLAVLSLKNNSLSGPLPTAIGDMQNLRVLSLSKNQLTGEVPDLGRLTNLQVLDLGDNLLGPHFPIFPKRLVTLLLKNNRFRFGIPSELTSLYLLKRFDISMNGFVGPFLQPLFSLPSITYLNIGGNKFTGRFFQNMSCNNDLVFVNVSSNLLTGDLPTCLQMGGKNEVILYSRNCLSNKNGDQLPFNFCHNEALAVRIAPQTHHNNRAYAKSILALGIVGGIALGPLIIALVFLGVKWRNSKNSSETPSTRFITENVSTLNTAKLLYDAKAISQTMKLGANLPAYRTFSLVELKEATNNFDPSALIKEGSHAQLYRGKLIDGRSVAIKCLKLEKKQNQHQLELISKLRHSHLVSALGHCYETQQDDSSVAKIFLVFEYFPCMTLRSYISGPGGQKLSWLQRIAAVIEVVKGIQFLHTGILPGIYSNNVKITDILLDQNLHVKISSYNLPLLAQNNRTLMVGYGPKGKQPRTKDEDKNDVYDIGVMLVEVILGRPIMFQNEVGVLKDLLQVSILTDEKARRNIVDAGVHKECSDKSLKTMMEICVRCLSKDPGNRPSVEDILWNLQFAAQVQGSKKGNARNILDSPASSSSP